MIQFKLTLIYLILGAWYSFSILVYFSFFLIAPLKEQVSVASVCVCMCVCEISFIICIC